MSNTSEPHLKRAPGPFALTLFGVTYMTVITVFTTYGIVNQVTDGHLPAAYLIAVFAMLFTAVSYGSMVRKYPVAGSAYTYTQQSFGGTVGFITGWVMLLDYLFLPMINFLAIGIYMHTQFPAVPGWAFALVSLIVVLVFNILGITLLNKVNMVIIGLALVLVVVFVALAFKSALGGDLSIGLLEPFTFGEGGLGAIAAGSAILALSFLGFDAVSTLSEEAKQPRRDIPRAIVLSTLIGGFLFILISWSGALAHQPEWSEVTPEQADSCGEILTRHIGGEAFALFFVAVYVVGCFGSAMTSQVSVSRILYAMGRDGVLPKPLARLHRRFGTPVVAAIVVSVFALLSLFVGLSTVAFMISFGALMAFAMVNLSVIRTYLMPKGGHAGRRSVRELAVYGAAPLIGFALIIWLWTSLEPLTWLIGAAWIALGVIILAFRTGGFRRPVPTMVFSEDDPGSMETTTPAAVRTLEGEAK